MKSNQLLKPEFLKLLCGRVESGLTGYDTAVDRIFNELVRKLCNTRLNEFITAHREKMDQLQLLDKIYVILFAHNIPN